MKKEVESAIRAVLRSDVELTDLRIEEAICIMKDDKKNPISPLHCIRYKELCDITQLNRQTIEKYVQLGILERAYKQGSSLAIGVTRESYDRLVSRNTRSWPRELEEKVRSKIHAYQAH